MTDAHAKTRSYFDRITNPKNFALGQSAKSREPKQNTKASNLLMLGKAKVMEGSLPDERLGIPVILGGEVSLDYLKKHL